ncbi:MAG: hypothetical protein ACI8RZ_005426 [Myxococcota bacterium]
MDYRIDCVGKIDGTLTLLPGVVFEGLETGIVGYGGDISIESGELRGADGGSWRGLYFDDTATLLCDDD